MYNSVCLAQLPAGIASSDEEVKEVFCQYMDCSFNGPSGTLPANGLHVSLVCRYIGVCDLAVHLRGSHRLYIVLRYTTLYCKALHTWL